MGLKSGLFTWKIASSARVEIGSIAGTKVKGYIHIKINKKIYKAHRLAWLYVHGEYPNHHIDHKNHKKDDNRFKNLRDITHQENMKNTSKRKSNTSGVVGVSWNKQRNKWCASIRVDGKNTHLGYFANKKDAVRTRKDAEVQHGYHKNHGKGKAK